MQYPSFTSKKYIPSCLLKLITLAVIFNICSCGCDEKTVTKKGGGNTDNLPRRDEKPIELVLTAAGKTSIQGAEPIQLQIANKGTQATIAKPTLQITRTKGVDASIKGATDKGNGKYELALNEVAAKNHIVEDLTVLASLDTQASFEFQILYAGNHSENKVTLDWVKGAALELKDVQYNKDNGYITYSLMNTGSEPLKQLKLQYKSKTPGIKLGGAALAQGKEIIVDIADNLNPGTKKENVKLAQLDFGTNQQVDFEFRVVYEGGATAPTNHVLTPTEINLTLALTYDEKNKKLTYTIENKGNDIAKAVKLAYNNVSTDAGEASVLLDGKKNGETIPQDLAGKITHTLSLDFNTQEKALFEFKVFCNGIMLNNLTESKKLIAPPLQASLGTLGLEFYENKQQKTKLLEDPTRKVEVTIYKKNYEQIDPDQLELSITKKVGQNGYLSRTAGAGSEEKITGQGIGSIVGYTTNLALHVTPGTDDDLEFELQLFYNKQPMGAPLMVAWKAPEVALKLSWVDPQAQTPASLLLGMYNDPLSPQFVTLQPTKRAIKLKIEKNKTSRIIDFSQLRLALEKNAGSNAILSTTSGGLEVNELAGSNLGNIGDVITVYMDPKVDTSLSLKLSLYYKEKLQNIPLRLDWGLANPHNHLESLQEQMPELLQKGDFKKAKSIFAEACVQLASSAKNEKDDAIAKKMYEQLVQTLESRIQQDIMFDILSTSDVIEFAEIAETLSKNKQPFVEIDRLQEIAKKVYVNIFNTLEKKLTRKLIASDANNLLKDVQKLTVMSNTYGLDENKVKELNKAAYSAVVQTRLDIAKENQEWAKNSPSSVTSYAKDALKAAQQAAAATQQAGTDFGSSELTQAARQTYTTTAQIWSDIAKKNQEMAKNFPFSATSYAKDALKAAQQAAAAAQKAGTDFGSTELNQAVKETYVIAAQIQLSIVKTMKKNASTPTYSTLYDVGYTSASQADLALKASNQITTIAKEAKDKGFGSPELNQTVKEAYTVTLAIYKNLKDDVKHSKPIQAIENALKSL